MMLDDLVRRPVQEFLADPRPSVSAEDVFARLRARSAEQLRREEQGD